MSVKPCEVRSSGDTSDTSSSYVSDEEEAIVMMTNPKAEEQLSSLFQATEHDVYIGRGNNGFADKNHGLYRKLIQVHTKGYFDAPLGVKKAFIMDNIVNVIRREGGNFYTNRNNKDCNVWKVASEESIIRKIKLAMMDLIMQEKAEEKDKLESQENGIKQSSIRANIRPSPIVLKTTRLNNNMPNMPNSIPQGLPRDVPNDVPQDITQNYLLDAARSQAKALAAVTAQASASQVPSRAQTLYPDLTVASPCKTNVPQKRILYINEKTGHLLNINAREDNLYHDLLIRHANSFYERFGKSNAAMENMWNEDSRVRFVWDNIISELQRSNSFHIVLCPHSQKSIDVDPNKLQLLSQNPKHIDVTFRTILSIIAALSDRQYIAAVLAAKQQKILSAGEASSNTLDMEMRQLRARQMQQSIQQNQGQATVLQGQQLPTFAARKQDPAMVSNGSCTMDSTPQTNNDAVLAAAVVAQFAQNKKDEETIQKLKEIQAIGAARDMVRSKLRNLQGLGEMASAVLTKDRHMQEQQRQRQIEQQRRLQIGQQVEQQRRLQMEQQFRNMMPGMTNQIPPHIAEMRNKMLHTVAMHTQRNKEMEKARKNKAINELRKLTVATNTNKKAPLNDPPQKPKKKEKVYFISQRQWVPRITALLEFYVEHGSFEVPENYEDPELFDFVDIVRYLRKEKKCGRHGRFFDKWEQFLDRIGFSWEPPNGTAAPHRSEREQRKIDCTILREFGKTHPNIRVLLKSPRFAWIAKWVNERRIRAQKLNKEFDEERLMELFGFQWEHPPAEKPQLERETNSLQDENLLLRKRKLDDLDNLSDDDIVI